METITKEELIKWLENKDKPLKMICTKISEDTIVLQKTEITLN